MANFRAILRKQVPEPTWNTWLAPLMLLEANESHFVVGAPNSMIFERVATRYQGMIEGALAEATSTNTVKLELVVHEVAADAALAADDGASNGSLPFLSEQTTDRRRSWPQRQTLAGGEILPYTNRVRPTRPPGTTNGAQTTLNPRYTFEAFVIGGSDRFAHAAAQRVAEEPAKAYNPLFIYGSSGLGKTHMLHAIGHYDYQNFPHLNVCYVSTETFLNEFIDAIRTHGQTAFKRRYRAYDVLLVDDIQLLEGKKETQEEFFYTFNSFYEAEKQIVISSDRHPRSIATLEDRLRSRFESGLITDVQPPS